MAGGRSRLEFSVQEGAGRGPGPRWLLDILLGRAQLHQLGPLLGRAELRHALPCHVSDDGVPQLRMLREHAREARHVLGLEGLHERREVPSKRRQL